MEIAMAFIFALTDLFVVGVCALTYQNRRTYENGMLCGVHLPKEAVTDPEVTALVEKNARTLKYFMRVNLLLSVLCCIPMCFDLLTGFSIWTVWLILYLFFLNHLILQPFRTLYDLKLKRGWVDETKQHLRYIDTEAAKETRGLPGLRPHVFCLSMILLAAVFLYRRFQGSAVDTTLLILTLLSLFLTVLFFLLTAFVRRERNDVVSEDAKINAAAAYLRKSGWDKGLFYADMGNTASFLLFSLLVYRHGWIYEVDFWIYIILQMVSAFLLFFPIWSAEKERRELLPAAEGKTLYTDDDAYWRTGNYNNPKDRRIFVQSRFSDMQFTFNLGHPVGWVLMLLTNVLLICSVLMLLLLPVYLKKIEVNLTADDTGFRIEASFYGYRAAKEEILEASLLPHLPQEAMLRENGIETEDFAIGRFSGEESGKCLLFLYRSTEEVIRIKTEDALLYVNAGTAAETEKWYSMLEMEGP